VIFRQADAEITHRSEIGPNGRTRKQNDRFGERPARVVAGDGGENVPRVPEMNNDRVKASFEVAYESSISSSPSVRPNSRMFTQVPLDSHDFQRTVG